MAYNEKHSNSRRDFLKKTSLFWIGNILLGDPVVKFVAEGIGIRPVGEMPGTLSCELFRSQDLMHFKYFFYNVRLSGKKIRSDNNGRPIYILIQTPSQHIAEELLVKLPTERSGYSKQRSFLAKSSWLAFKLPPGKSLRLTPERLVDWSEWDMVTIDDFAYMGNKHSPDYKKALVQIDEKFKKGWIYDNTADQYRVEGIPLTTFEIPYKMLLSPISLPDKGIQDKTGRMLGEYVFTKDNEVEIHYANNDRRSAKIEIISPWRNTLAFKDLLQNFSPPRFKVVGYVGQECDLEEKAELLPSPIDRADLKGLTIKPEYDRDVISDYFTISARGGTTSLKYKNDDPTFSHALVAWDQIIKDGRDNFTKVTYRAIDVFTGLKLMVSIVSPREFAHGVSFLPKRYYITYAEKEKDYNAKETRSKLPFVRIIPKTEGAYFTPVVQNGDPSKGKYYLVAKEGKNPYKPGNVLDPENLLDFEYIGIDKEGVSHAFKSKIIFITAEGYHITSTKPFVYDLHGERQPYANGKEVDIRHIGLLNPYRNENFTGSIPVQQCGTQDEYTFKLTKRFLNEQAEMNDLRILIDAINKHINANADSYAIRMRSDLTYVKIAKLKEGANPIVSKESVNATFKTDVVLLNPEENLFLTAGGPLEDHYIKTFPLIPAMAQAKVTISQIDQIRGRTEYYLVRYYENYRQSNEELEDYTGGDKLKNNAFIFFELHTPISNFFTGNYKSSGAMVNPGITISHVSALDNSIAFNESHDEKQIITTDGSTAQKSVNPLPAIPSVSIFKELKAEILGISIADILQEFMPIGDLPILKFADQMEQSLERITQLAQEYRELAGDWIQEYNKAVSQVKDFSEKIANLRSELDVLAKNGVRQWLDAYVEQSNLCFYLFDQQQALKNLKADYTAYSATYIAKVLEDLKAIENRVYSDLITAIEAVVTDPSAAKINFFLALAYDKKTLYNERYLKELLKAYFAKKIIEGIIADNRICTAAAAMTAMMKQVDQRYLSCYNAALQGIQESLAFSEAFIGDKLNTLRNQVRDAQKNIPLIVKEAIEGFGIKSEDLDKTIAMVYRLSKVYENYKRLYTDLQLENYERLLLDLGRVAQNDPFLASFRKDIGKLEEKLCLAFKSTVEGIDLKIDDEPLKNAFDSVKKKLIEVADSNEVLQKFEANIATIPIQKMLASYTQLASEYYEKYDKARALLQQYEEEIKAPEKTVREFLNNQLQALSRLLDEKLQELAEEYIAHGKSSAAYIRLSKEVSNIENFLKKIRELSRQKLEYTMRTKNFRRASLGGVIEFVPVPGTTELSVYVKYEIEFAINSISKPPAVSKQSWITDTSLSAFKIGMLQLLYIDFERVSFVTGSDVKDDFVVRIKNVEFTGFLGFFQAFQDYLKSISDNLVFDISSSGAKIGYGVTIPNFQAGYFNFFNLSLNAMMVLPFQPEKSMQMHFGIGNELNKFGLTVMVIFGGQGYFKIIAEPRRGIVGMEVVLEFGAIFNLDLFIVKGTAYMVGGIYIRRYGSKYELRAYILCVGRLRVLGLFSASLSFYMALEGDSDVIEGVCRVRASHRFGPFFTISVECEMRKAIKGARTQPTTSGPDGEGSRLYAKRQGEIVETYYDDQAISFFLSTSDDHKPTVTLLDNSDNNVTPKNMVSKRSQGLYEVYSSLRGFKAGSYTMNVEHSGQTDIYALTILKTKNSCDINLKKNRDIPAEEYYSSYFYNI